MRMRWTQERWRARLQYRFAEAAGEGGDGGGEGGEDEDAFDPKASLTAVNATIAALQTDIKAAKRYGGDISALKKMVGDLTETVKALKPAETSGDTETDEDETEDETPPKRPARAKKVTTTSDEKTGDVGADAAIAALQKKIKELEGGLKRASDETATERSARVAAETKQRNLERDRNILDAATVIGLADDVDPKHVLRHFKDECEFDEDADAWVYVDGDERLTIADGVKKFLPKYMQKPKVTKGGSGGTSPGGDKGPTPATLKTAAITLGKDAQKNPRLLSRYTAAKKAAVDAGVDVSEITDGVSQGV